MRGVISQRVPGAARQPIAISLSEEAATVESGLQLSASMGSGPGFALPE